jgi:predicted HicB family RNase H-like nuclease
VRTAAVAIMVRLPAPLHERARRKAFRDRTSLNKLVIAALELYLRPAGRKGASS